MPYQKLLTLFHKDEEKWNNEYFSLFNAPTTRHIDIPICQYQSTHTFPAFFYYTEEIANILSDITQELISLTKITCKLPNIALGHFTKSCLIEEIQSSNDIEGVRSTKKEINTAIDEQSNEENKKKTRLWSIVNKYMRLQSEYDIPFNTSQDLRNFYDSFVLDEVCREDPMNAPDGKIFRKDMVEVNAKSKIIHQGIYPESKIIEFMDISLSIL